jgi:hypothetical protein
MNRLGLIAFVLTGLASTTPAQADERFGLDVLYAGNPGSEREKDFTTLLNRYFTKVSATDYRRFTAESAKGHDVVILDWTSIYPRDEHGKIAEKFDRLNSPDPIPQVTESYDRPTILIGAAGGWVAQRVRLKIDWR